MALTSGCYELLHGLEEDGLLDPSNSLHLFCAQYIFVPRLRVDLDTFKDGWDNRPLRTEQNLTPNQLWTIGLLQSPVAAPENLESVQNVLDGDLDDSAGVVLPPVHCPLDPQAMVELMTTINPLAPFTQRHWTL